MKPSEVRQNILAQHEELRGLLKSLHTLAKQASESDDSCVPALRELGLYLRAKLVEHLDFEDEHLVPAIRDADGWGDARAELLAAEHLEQRELFRYILERLEDRDRASVLLGNELLAFVDVLLDDMEHEDRAVLDPKLLRDDPIGVDVEAG